MARREKAEIRAGLAEAILPKDGTLQSPDSPAEPALIPDIRVKRLGCPRVSASVGLDK